MTNYEKYHSKGKDYRTKKVPLWIASQFTEWELTPQIKTVRRGSKVNTYCHETKDSD